MKLSQDRIETPKLIVAFCDFYSSDFLLCQKITQTEGDAELGTPELDETEVGTPKQMKQKQIPQTWIQHCNPEIGVTWYFELLVKPDLGTTSQNQKQVYH